MRKCITPKPCPFCGGKKVSDFYQGVNYFSAICDKCGAESGMVFCDSKLTHSQKRNRIIKKWNIRHEITS